MTRTISSLSHAEKCSFEQSTHLYATNSSIVPHNKHMLKHLNMPIAHCFAEQRNKHVCQSIDDEQFQLKVLLVIGQEVMLTTNLWVQARLVNDSLGKVIDIVYNSNEQPPSLPSFVVVEFLHYKGPLWDASNPTYVPIPPITKGSRRKLPLSMAWGLTIHKAQGMTLQNVTIDIGNIDRQGLTFTVISRVTSLSCLCISPSFSSSRYC